MRVVAGTHGGRRLHRPSGDATRPTSDRVREAVFATLGNVRGDRVLDLFAGSGALGIEALSRGAAEAVFVDTAHGAIEAVRRNLDELGLDGVVHRREALAYLRGGAAEAPFDLVLLDPPYDSAVRMAPDLAELLPGVLSDNAILVTESDHRTPLELPFTLVRERTYGDTRVAIHRCDR